MENPFKPLLKKAPFLFNKFFIVSLAFVIWIVFFDRFDKISGAKLDNTISTLEQEKLDLNQSIKDVQDELDDIVNNKEKFVRKNGYLKRDNEEVYIIEKNKK